MYNILQTRKTIGAILAALAAALLCKLFVFDFMLVEGASMEDALTAGEVIIVNKIAYGVRAPFAQNKSYVVRWKNVAENDIVVFAVPSGKLAVKRAGGVFEVGGALYFLALGDNSLQSYDSRSYGPVPQDDIVGKVILYGKR